MIETLKPPTFARPTVRYLGTCRNCGAVFRCDETDLTWLSVTDVPLIACPVPMNEERPCSGGGRHDPHNP